MYDYKPLAMLYLRHAIWIEKHKNATNDHCDCDYTSDQVPKPKEKINLLIDYI